jgi:hypothetical protein
VARASQRERSSKPGDSSARNDEPHMANLNGQPDSSRTLCATAKAEFAAGTPR